MGSQAGFSNRDAGICSWVALLTSPRHSAETQEDFNLKRNQGSKSYDEPRQRWIIEKARKFQKNIYFCFIDYTKAFDCVDHNKLANSSRVGIPDHLTCLQRNLYANQIATVRTGHGTTDWFQIGKGVCQGCTLSLLI